MTEPEIVITWIGGNCPVQAEGTIDGHPFYFRARGNHWSLEIGGELHLGEPAWECDWPYGEEKFAAGWMSVEEARAFIKQGAEQWAMRHDASDGQPDEQQEWASYDADC